jgi:hypothetical protein
MVGESFVVSSVIREATKHRALDSVIVGIVRILCPSPFEVGNVRRSLGQKFRLDGRLAYSGPWSALPGDDRPQVAAVGVRKEQHARENVGWRVKLLIDETPARTVDV